MPHYLDPLLRPRSIAVLGATQRRGTVGNTIVQNLMRGGFPGALFAVNPNYRDVEGVPCYPTLDQLPGKAEQVIFAVADLRIEAALEAAIKHGMRSCVIYSTLVLAEDGTPTLRERIRDRLRRANVLACGGNGMGYYNFPERIWACGFATRAHLPPGNVVLLSQSGSGMSGILDAEARINFNLAVSTGQELSVTLEDYLDFALEQAETRVIGLFLETIRSPAKFSAALNKARARGTPIVAIKVGRTELSAQLAVSHCGALAGTDSVYDAVFEKHGVQRVRDMDELASALIMFAQPHRVAAGGLVTLHDSGGERQLFIDLASELRVRLAVLNETTVAALRAMLDPGLAAVNPLDGWSSGGNDSHDRMASCFATLLADPDAAFGAVVHDRSSEGVIWPDYARYLRRAHEAGGKPVFLVSNRQGVGCDTLAVELTRHGFPVLDGVCSFLAGARCLLEFRDAQSRTNAPVTFVGKVMQDRWHARLQTRSPLSHVETMRFLSDCGLPVTPVQEVRNGDELQALAGGLEYPVVLKSAGPGLAHRSDVCGVVLDIPDAKSLHVAYREMMARLGPLATVAPMVREYGLEMILGIKRDDQFGPVVIFGMGGVHAELLHDVVSALPPVDEADALRLLDRLRLRALLDGVRGQPAVDLDDFCKAVRVMSEIAMSFDTVREVDVNPLLVMQRGCIALDGLIVAQ